MLRKIGFLSEEQFQEAARRSRLSQKGIDAARKVLVLRESQSSVSRDIGVSREKVRQYCHAIYRRHAAHSSCPDGWISTTVCLPKAEIKAIMALEARLRMEHECRAGEARKPKPVKAKSQPRPAPDTPKTDD